MDTNTLPVYLTLEEIAAWLRVTPSIAKLTIERLTRTGYLPIGGGLMYLAGRVRETPHYDATLIANALRRSSEDAALRTRAVKRSGKKRKG